MADGSVGEKTVTKIELWRERITEQGRSGVSVKQFCQERGFTAWSFYSWRKRLRESGPVRFALVQRESGRQECAADTRLELVLASGERLRIAAGVDGATLRTVLEALRA